ncbi:MAG: aldose 1-epimerase [Chloroflexi bacterium]|nr:aldose 1-epimerase [Chloroflexota bacterium]
MTAGGGRNFGCRLTTDATLAGYRIVVLENDLLRVTVLADKGSDIYEFLYKPLDVDVMWRSPVGLRPPGITVPTAGGEAGFFMDTYEGGWQEILPSGGPNTIYRGVRLGQHGEVSTVPWTVTIEQDEVDRVAVRFSTRTIRMPFRIEKTLALERGTAVLHLSERLTNEADEPVDYMWGHHPTFGEALLDDSCVIQAPARTLVAHPGEVFDTQRLAPDSRHAWPWATDRHGARLDFSRVPGPEARIADMTYLTDLTDGWYGLTNQRRKVGVGMVFPHEVFSVIWYWLVARGGFGPPWWGRTYNLALEPWTSWPGTGLGDVVARGQARQLAAGESLAVEIKAVMWAGIEGIAGIDPDGTVRE